MKKILILSNHHSYTYNFRKEIIQELLNKHYKVLIALPYGEKVDLLEEMGCECIDISLDRRGKNPIKDAQLIFKYYQIMKKFKPDAVLSYTIKPNIYGGIVTRLLKIPFFPNVTGLGSAVEIKSIFQKLIISLYKFAYKNATCVFFQNKENELFFLENGFKLQRHRLIPGSGVNTSFFELLPYPSSETIEFMFISRIMKEKGIEQYLEAAVEIKKKYSNINFNVLGFCEEKYEERLLELHEQNIIIYHGMQSDIKKFQKISHCTIHPTYYPEGMSNVLLESAACGRPLITTNRSGCKEIVDDNVNGFIINQEDTQDLIKKIESFLSLNYEEKKEMGVMGRKKIVAEFDRKIVVDSYLQEVNKVL